MSVKTCASCPSYLPKDDPSIRAKFGKNIDSPMCGRFGYVLGRPGLDTDDQIGAHYALRCGSFGAEALATPESISHVVISPKPGLMTTTGSDTVTTCNGCSNHITAEAMRDTFGWPVGACQAKGSLVLKPISEGAACPYSIHGAPTAAGDYILTKIELLEPFKSGFKLSTADAAKAYSGMVGAGSGDGVFDPATAPTEAPVDADDSRVFRAWFKVVNEEAPGGPEVHYLPRFNRNFFTPEQQLHIPATGDGQHPEDYIDHNRLLTEFAIESYVHGMNLIFMGEPGAGKTEAGRYFAWLMQIPFTLLSMTSEMDIQEFLGEPTFIDGTLGFTPGRLPRAYTAPGMICSDEVNKAPDAVLETYRSLMTGADDLYVGNQRFVRNDYCFHILTSNPSWDYRNLGTKPLADADMDRMAPVDVAPPPPPLMRLIIERNLSREQRVLPEDTLETIMKVHDDLREMGNQGTLPFRWGLRKTARAAVLATHFPLLKAFRRAALDFASPEEREVAYAAINSIIGGGSHSF